jgi:hypothetical protein
MTTLQHQTIPRSLLASLIPNWRASTSALARQLRRAARGQHGRPKAGLLRAADACDQARTAAAAVDAANRAHLAAQDAVVAPASSHVQLQAAMVELVAIVALSAARVSRDIDARGMGLE